MLHSAPSKKEQASLLLCCRTLCRTPVLHPLESLDPVEAADSFCASLEYCTNFPLQRLQPRLGVLCLMPNASCGALECLLALCGGRVPTACLCHKAPLKSMGVRAEDPPASGIRGAGGQFCACCLKHRLAWRLSISVHCRVWKYTVQFKCSRPVAGARPYVDVRPVDTSSRCHQMY